MERRIAAILAADMVGFSRLVELDEAGTLDRQKRHRLDLIAPAFARNNGRIVKMTGDGLIAEFGSVVEAVQCAVAIQKEMGAREQDQPEDRRIRYRVGINLGDIVIDDDGDIYGDGVNIAARLEGLAEPGGVVVSGTAYDMLKAQVDVGYVPMGEQKLKNIAAPVRVYQVTDDPADTPPPPRPTRSRRLPIAGAALVLTCLALGWFWWSPRPDFTPANPDKMAFALPDKPLIAVTRFEDQTTDNDLRWLSDSLSENIAATLAYSPEIVVISYKSTGDMRQSPPSQVAEAFGVRYVLEGAVRQNADTLRVSANLLDTQNGRIIWAERGPDNIFDAQDAIAANVLTELQVKLTLGEQVRGWRENLGSTENVRDMVQGRVAFQKWTPADHAIAARHFQAIYDRNPELAGATMLMGYAVWQRVVVGISDDPAADYARAMQFADTSIEQGGDGNSYTLKAMLLTDMGQFEESAEMIRKSVAMTPNGADVLMVGGSTIVRAGYISEGIDLMERGIRLEPDFPEWVAGRLAQANLQLGDEDRAREYARGIVASNGVDMMTLVRAHSILAILARRAGDMATAKRHVADMLGVLPGLTRAGAEPLYINSDRDYVAGYFDALVAAGLPEN